MRDLIINIFAKGDYLFNIENQHGVMKDHTRDMYQYLTDIFVCNEEKDGQIIEN